MINKTNNKQYLIKRNIILLVVTILALVVILIAAFLLIQPERSVASFCSVAKEQKAVLTADVGYDKRLEAYKKLEAVSPDDIQSDITTIRKGYESIVQNPSNTISAGLGMSGAENRRTDYIAKNCSGF
jgi:FtsZ-interacting cell division protein ZipA